MIAELIFKTVWAANIQVTSTIATNLPGLGGAGTNPANPLENAAGFFKFVLGLVGLLALIMIIVGAIRYTLSASSTSGKSDSKEYITQAFYGILLLAGAFLFLQLINPDITKFDFPTLEKLTAPTSTPFGFGSTSTGPTLSNTEARARLAAAGITVWESRAGATSLDGISEAAINEAIRMKNSCGCTVQVNGGTESGHSSCVRSTSCCHANGCKLDFQTNSTLDAYIQNPNNCTRNGTRTGNNGGARYMCGNIEYVNEGSHWDMSLHS